MVRQFLILRIRNLEGGEKYSATIRRLLLKYHNIKVGMYSYGGCFRLGQIPPGTEIGRYCSFAEHVQVIGANHPMESTSTHPFFYNPSYGFVEKDLVNRTKLTMGNDVWVGHHAILLPSVSTIGHGAVIGAGSVVVKDVPPYAVVVGNPAKIVKYRFSGEKVKELIESAWWEKDIDEVRNQGLL